MARIASASPAQQSAPGADGEERAGSKKIGVLASLWPFMRPYRLLMAAAIAGAGSDGRYYADAAAGGAPCGRQFPDRRRRAVGLVLFGGSWHCLPFWRLGPVCAMHLVTRLGERVVADIRKAVFDRVIGMSPEFYERIMTGEVLSRITTDTTLIQSVLGSSVSIALCAMCSLLFAGGLVLMLLTSAKLTGMVLLLIPLVVVPILRVGPPAAGDKPGKPGLDCCLIRQRG